MADGEDAATRRRAAITDYRKKLLNCRELESRVGTGIGATGGPTIDRFLDLNQDRVDGLEVLVIIDERDVANEELQENGLATKVEKSRKQMKERKNRAKKIRGVKKTKAGDAKKK